MHVSEYWSEVEKVWISLEKIIDLVDSKVSKSFVFDFIMPYYFAGIVALNFCLDRRTRDHM